MYPDEVIGLGGTGKTLVKELLKSEWFVEDVISKWEENIQQGGRFGGTKIRFIDSDTSQMPSDRKELEEIKKTINEVGKKVLERKDDYAVKVFNLNENAYVNLAPGMSTQLLDPKFEAAVLKNEKLKTEVWWVDDEDHGLKNFAKTVDPNFDSASFANGVVRKRFLAKSLIYYYLATKEARHLELMGTGRHIAIVTAFGGGTGSGIFLDLAKWLKNSIPNCAVTLFAVLPTGEERGSEAVNAYAALSELEQEKEDYIDLAILLPLDLSGYKGGDIRIHPGLKSFSENFPYNFCGIYDRVFTDDESLGQGHIEFSKIPFKKFVVSSAYSVRYAADKLRDKDFKVSETLKTLKEYCDTEEKLRGKIDKVIKRFELQTSRTEEKGELSSERLKEFKDCFYEGDFPELLRSTNYGIVNKMKQFIIEEKLWEDELSRLRASVLSILEEELPIKDKDLLNIAKKWLKNIDNFTEQALAIESIPDLPIRDIFIKVVKSIPIGADKMKLEDSIKTLKVNLTKIESELNEIEGKIQNLEKIKFIKDFLEKCKERKEILFNMDARENEDRWKKEINPEEAIIRLREWGASRLEEDMKGLSEYYRLLATENYYNKEKRILKVIKRKRKPKLAEKANVRKEDFARRLKYFRKDTETDDIELRENLFEIFASQEMGAMNVEKNLDLLKKRKGDLITQKESNEKLQSLSTEIWDLLEPSEKVYSLRQKTHNKMEDVIKISEGARRGEFVLELMPKDSGIIKNLTESSDITLFNEFEGSRDFDEIQRALTDSFRELVTPGTREENKFMCVKGTVTGEINGRKRSVGPNFLKIITLSRNENLRPDLNYESIRDIYSVPATNISEIPLRQGGNWDTSFVTAIMFLPLEMLINVSRYYDAYVDKLNREGYIGILKHHSANLERGKFFVRERCLTDTEVIELSDMPEDAQREKLDGLYKEISLGNLVEGSSRGL
ncbi:MAG: hypothetical protein JW878_07690 [Methanomicrobia archaeon]|nr:hypothetical protein [Methanomicrobia archaeon]